MNLALIESTNCLKSYASSLLCGKDYEDKLKESILQLADHPAEGVSDFSALKSTFFELVQARLDPPLEAIWIFASLSFRDRTFERDELLSRVSTASDLFQFFSACSASCSGPGSIALLAPLMFEVCTTITRIWEKELPLKSEKKAMRKAESLVAAIVGFVSLCYCRDPNQEEKTSIDLASSLLNPACFWAHHGSDGKGKNLENLKNLFPLVNDEILSRLGEDETDICFLAGVVALEAFLLRLCIKFRGGVLKSELHKDLRTWAVGSINGFQSYYFFDLLLRILLGPTLPLTSLLCSEEEIMLRKILYDAVILVEYSFIKAERVIEASAEPTRSLVIRRLIVTQKAIELLREDGDQTKAVSYTDAFCSSSSPFLLTKLVTGQFGAEAKAARPNGSSPKAFIKWLVDLEDLGMRVFNDDNLKYHAKQIVRISEIGHDQPLGKAGDRNADSGLTFYIDNKGDAEHGDQGCEGDESVSAAFVEASHLIMADHGLNRRRKRNVGRRSMEPKGVVKFVKYSLEDSCKSGSSGLAVPTGIMGDSGSGSDVEDPLSDDDDDDDAVEAREQ